MDYKNMTLVQLTLEEKKITKLFTKASNNNDYTSMKYYDNKLDLINREIKRKRRELEL